MHAHIHTLSPTDPNPGVRGRGRGHPSACSDTAQLLVGNRVTAYMIEDFFESIVSDSSQSGRIVTITKTNRVMYALQDTETTKVDLGRFRLQRVGPGERKSNEGWRQRERVMREEIEKVHYT